MKKAILLAVAIAALMFLFSGVSKAVLIDRGGGMIYDTDQDITWLQDANYAMTSGYDGQTEWNGMNWSDAVAWADQLVYAGYENWRLPSTVDGPWLFGYDGTTTGGYNITTSEMGYMYYNNLGNTGYFDKYGTPHPDPVLNNTGPFINIQMESYDFWSGTECSDNLTQAWTFDLIHGYQNDDDKNDIHRAWAVRDGDVSSAPNQPPIADAGPDQTVECTGPGGTFITLDGSGSSDPDSTPGTNDDIVSFKWYEAEISIGDTEILDYLFEVDTHPITLEVTDSNGETDSDQTNIIIQDTTAPSISVSATPNVLWPPNHKMVHVTTTVTATDNCDTEPAIKLVSIVMDESDETITFDPDYDLSVNDGKTSGDIQIVDDYNFYLRSERSGKSDGRTYTITYKAVDESGNESTAYAEVFVPHSM